LTDLATAPPPSAAPAPEDILTADGLNKEFRISRDPNHVLKGVSLRVARGEFVAIMGPSGCGKSTLLHVLGGLEPPDSGSVRVAGEDLYAMADEALTAFRRDRMGFVFQLFNLLPTLTAAENVALPLRLRRPALSRRDIQDRVRTLMGSMGLHDLQGHGPEDISGGEAQRVAIARALAASPDVLFADEPTGNLDWATSHEVMRVLARLSRDPDVQRPQTTVLVTHDARTAAYADRVLVMRDGEVVDDVRTQPLPGQSDEDPRDVRPLVERLQALGL
jgi:ABC-type lipoprotein export system ATPase subunit